MKPAELISYLYESGADISAQNGNLNIRAPRGLITKEIKGDLVYGKSEILKLLEEGLSDIEFTRMLEKACTNLALKPQQLWRFLSEDDIEGIRLGDISFDTLRAYAERWDDHPYLVVVGNDLPYPETPAPETVTCHVCQYFNPDTIGDGREIGECAKGLTGNHGKPLHPKAKRYCGSFEKVTK